MIDVYLGLGSNLSDPAQQLEVALKHLNSLQRSRLVTCSSFYSSTPMGPADQPDYVNAVSHLQTEQSAHQLLKLLQHIEQQHGRVRKGERWGPRTLDIDILLYGQQQIEEDDLVVPHYGMKQREFVLYPLFEIAPHLVLPCGNSVKNILNKVSENGLHIIKRNVSW